MMAGRFEELRRKHPVFHYHGYGLEETAGALRLHWHFSIDGLCEFHPETRIFTDNLCLLQNPNGAEAHKLLFALGLVEAVSYWKCACPPEVVIHCGGLNEAEIRWWKRLWFGGLGEFFYRNAIATDEESFVRFRCADAAPDVADAPQAAFRGSGLCLTPVGGGKDSCVTLDLLREAGVPLLGFTVNDQPARSETFAAAGFAQEQLLRTKRGIDPALLQRNAEG
jgi:hypothetical protein